ncbi:MAG: pyrroline-5-carboxylate reductase [Bacillota bacterium]|nr:pyrroline-5-carboxylate reductase [Bacillota bacterium]
MEIKVGFIGTGNMGTALIKSIVKSGALPAQNLYIYDVDKSKLAALAEETGTIAAASATQLVQTSDVVILAVKPNIVKTALESCKTEFTGQKLLVSIAVGIPIKFYKDIIGQDKKVVRVMPNTPALVGEGMSLISYGKEVTESDAENVRMLLECAGKVEYLEEKLMSEVTALTGSSPAYVFMFIEAMADAAVLSGIPRNLAYRLAAQAVLGSAKMVLDTGKHPGELKDQVCSPAGTTIEAVSSLEKNGFRYAVMEAMNECTKKAREFGKIYG